MLKLSKATKERLEKVFGPELRREAARILTEECGNNLPFCENQDEFGMERIRFAVLKLWTDVMDVPPSLIAGSSHPLFVGMVTNTLFGLLFDLNRDRRSIWPWADHVVFWGVSVATAAFTAAILLEANWAFKFVTPVLGISILIGIAAHTLRLRSRAVATPGRMPAT